MNSTWQCPFCCSEVHQDAVICPHCRSDLHLARPLMFKLLDLDRRLLALQEVIERHEVAIESIRQPTSAGPEAPVLASGVFVSVAPEGVAAVASPWRQFAGLTVAWVTIVLLHWLLLFVYDAPLVILRVSTLLVPMVVAWLVYLRRKPAMRALTGLSAVLGTVAVLSMLTVTSAIDHVPLFPASVREWRETLEYLAGISLAYLAGGLFANALACAPAPPTRSVVLLLFERDAEGRIKVEEIVSQLTRLMAVSAPIASGASAFYSGLKGVIGN